MTTVRTPHERLDLLTMWRENGKQFIVLYNLNCKERQPHATLHFYQLNATTILPRFIACPQNKNKATTTATTTTKQQRVQHKTSNFGAAVAVRTRLKPSLRCACFPLHSLSPALSPSLSLSFSLGAWQTTISTQSALWHLIVNWVMAHWIAAAAVGSAVGVAAATALITVSVCYVRLACVALLLHATCLCAPSLLPESFVLTLAKIFLLFSFSRRYSRFVWTTHYWFIYIYFFGFDFGFVFIFCYCFAVPTPLPSPHALNNTCGIYRHFIYISFM